MSEMEQKLMLDLLKQARVAIDDVGADAAPGLSAAVDAIDVERKRAELQAQVERAQAALAELPAPPRRRGRKGA